MFGDALFRQGDLSSYLRQQDASIEQHVVQNVQTADLSQSDEAVVSRLLAQAIVSPLEIDFENPIKDIQERRVVVPDGFDGPVEIDGVRATRAFAFSGDRNLFQLRPNCWGGSPRGDVRDKTVVVGVDGRVDDTEALKQAMDRQETTLREYVANSNAQINSHNEALKGKFLDAVARRRAQLGKIEGLKGLL